MGTVQTRNCIHRLLVASSQQSHPEKRYCMSLEEDLVRILYERELRITTAESCTGGMIASTLVNVAGVSDVFDAGYVTYSEDAKITQLGVKRETLEKFTVYSEQVACEMAEGAAKTAGADVALSVTGIAGPDGGTPDFPVGLCYIGCYFDGEVVVERYVFEGDRQSVRGQAVKAALELAFKILGQ